MFLALALQYIPRIQVAQFNITNPKDLADAENSYRATLAQILGGVAVGIGIYFAWGNLKVAQATLDSNTINAQKSLEITQKGQITECFTRAVDQLGAIDKDGNPAIEIRLGGIYALKRIANESKADYWSIIEILTAYVRKNSPLKDRDENHVGVEAAQKLSLDIQTILTVVRRCRPPLNTEETNFFSSIEGDFVVYDSNYLIEETSYILEAPIYLDFHDTYLWKANLFGAYFQGANFEGADLSEANFSCAKLEGANLQNANLKQAIFDEANLYGAFLTNACLEGAKFSYAEIKYSFFTYARLKNASFQKADLYHSFLLGAYLEGVDFLGANLKGAILSEADLRGANLKWANLEETYFKNTKNLTVEQLSKAKTLYNAKLDEELLIPLKEKYPSLFEKPNDDGENSA